MPRRGIPVRSLDEIVWIGTTTVCRDGVIHGVDVALRIRQTPRAPTAVPSQAS